MVALRLPFGWKLWLLLTTTYLWHHDLEWQDAPRWIQFGWLKSLFTVWCRSYGNFWLGSLDMIRYFINCSCLHSIIARRALVWSLKRCDENIGFAGALCFLKLDWKWNKCFHITELSVLDNDDWWQYDHRNHKQMSQELYEYFSALWLLQSYFFHITHPDYQMGYVCKLANVYKAPLAAWQYFFTQPSFEEKQLFVWIEFLQLDPRPNCFILGWWVMGSCMVKLEVLAGLHRL